MTLARAQCQVLLSVQTSHKEEKTLLNNKKDWRELNERENWKKSETHLQCFVFIVDKTAEDKKIEKMRKHRVLVFVKLP